MYWLTTPQVVELAGLEQLHVFQDILALTAAHTILNVFLALEVARQAQRPKLQLRNPGLRRLVKLGLLPALPRQLLHLAILSQASHSMPTPITLLKYLHTQFLP